MSFDKILSVVIPVALAAVGWVIRNKVRIANAALFAISWAEKYKSGASNQELEDQAVLFARTQFPDLNPEAIRFAIRLWCARRKKAAGEIGG